MRYKSFCWACSEYTVHDENEEKCAMGIHDEKIFVVFCEHCRKPVITRYYYYNGVIQDYREVYEI